MNEDSMKELERLRKQISQQEKMASLGLLSAGIAHEIQNPLNFVINFSKLSCKLLQDMEDVLDELESHTYSFVSWQRSVAIYSSSLPRE